MQCPTSADRRPPHVTPNLLSSLLGRDRPSSVALRTTGLCIAAPYMLNTPPSPSAICRNQLSPPFFGAGRDPGDDGSGGMGVVAAPLICRVRGTGANTCTQSRMHTLEESTTGRASDGISLAFPKVDPVTTAAGASPRDADAARGTPRCPGEQHRTPTPPTQHFAGAPPLDHEQARDRGVALQENEVQALMGGVRSRPDPLPGMRLGLRVL